MVCDNIQNPTVNFMLNMLIGIYRVPGLFYTYLTHHLRAKIGFSAAFTSFLSF